MKISDTIIGSVIIGVLVGGAILLAGGGGYGKKHAQLKIIKVPHDERGVKKLIHKEIIIDQDSQSGMKLYINSDDITNDLPTDIADKVKEALSEALEGHLPEDLDIKIEIKTNK
tara:strand:+ start:555 stop:896 length:342 start_codon:yes stop_codon:yes gene_type:complete